jgi:hypothetical protein
MIKKQYVDLLCLLKHSCLYLEESKWEKDLLQDIKQVYLKYKEKHITKKVRKADLKSLETYLLCINTFDKKKVFNRNNRILR